MTTRQPVPPADEQPTARPGREAQRRRTRTAIVDAATRLISSGATPSVDDIAAAAEVSRRTVYLHFPTLDQLLLDATAGALSDAIVESAMHSDSDDPVARVDALVHALTRTAEKTLPLGRKIIALTVDADTGPGPRRGQRRTQWIDTALEPLRDRVTTEQFDRLAAGLSVLVGWEAMVVLRDIRGLDPTQEDQTLRWAATTLVRAILSE